MLLRKEYSMKNHSLYNIIKDKLSKNVQRKLEKQMEYNDAKKAKTEFEL